VGQEQGLWLGWPGWLALVLPWAWLPGISCLPLPEVSRIMLGLFMVLMAEVIM
jgi:hypothetical protein